MGALMKRIRGILALLLALCLLPTPLALATSVDAAPLSSLSGATDGMVRVFLSSLGNPASLTLTIAGSYTVNGSTAQTLSSGSRVTVGFSSATGGITLTSNGATTNMGSYFALRRHSATGSNGIQIAQARQPGNPYPGDLSFRSVRQSSGAYKLYTVAHVYMENYLYGVLPYEMGNSAGAEALKAQAVAARTYTLRMMNARSSGYYDVVDTTSDQVYNGTPSGNANCVAAVDATKGVVVMNGSALTMTYYSASNGGQTESAKNLWGSSGYDYLTVKDDPFDLQNPACTVKTTTVYASCAASGQNATLMSRLKTKVVSALQAKGYQATAANTTLGTISSVLPHTTKYASPSRLYTKMDFTVSATTQNSAGGSVAATVTVTFDIFTELEGTLNMSIQNASNELWTVAKSGGNFVLQARRFGHGIGMSQRGAMYMSKLGYSYAQILGFYYPGCQRVRHNFTNTILSAVGSGEVTDVTTVEEAAQIDETDSGSNATVKLVNASASLAIRATKSLTGTVLGAAASSAPVTVLANDGTWCYIQYGSVKGYVPASALSITGVVGGVTTEDVSQVLCYATVTNTTGLNLRSEGSYSGTILTTVANGSVLTVFSKSSGWAYVQFGATVAYACTDYLTFTDTYPGTLADSASVNAVVTLQNTSETVNFRSAPSTSASILATLPHGAQVVVTANDGSWCAVTYNGQQGYIIADYLTYADAVVTPGTAQTTTDLLEGEVRATVSADGGVLVIRAQANADASALAQATNGSSVIVTIKGDTWCVVRYEGVAGYAPTASLTFTATSQSGQSALTATVVTKSGSLNMRSESRAGSTILTTIPRGAAVVVTAQGATWCGVTYAGLSGYVMTQFLQITGTSAATDTPAQTGTQTATVTTASGSLNLRSLPKAGSAILRTIPQYAGVTVTEKGNDWCAVEYNGTSGYVMSVFLTFASEPVITPTPAPTVDPAALEDPASAETTTPAPTDGATVDPSATTPAPTDTPAAETPAPTAAPATGTVLYATVTTASGSLNLRQDALPGSPVLTRIPKGTTIQITERLAAWSKATYVGQTGYVMNAFLTFADTASGTPSATTSTSTGASSATVNTASGSLNLRLEPASGSQILARIPQYATVVVHTQGATWCYISYNGQYGYVMTHFLLLQSTAEAATATPAPATNTPATAASGATATPTAAAASGTETAWVSTTSGSLNLRSLPQNGSYILTTVPQYATVTVTQRGSVWCGVIYGAYAGYVQSQFLSFGTLTGTAQSGGTTTAWVTTAQGSLNLRMQPQAGSTILCAIPQYASVTVLSQDGAWWKVQYSDSVGYAQSAYLSVANPAGGATAAPTAAPATSEQTTAASTATATPTPVTIAQLILDPTLAAVLQKTTAVCTLPSGVATLTMYAQCSVQSDALTDIASGEQVNVLMVGDTWLMVSIDEFTGYCLRSYLTIQGS